MRVWGFEGLGCWGLRFGVLEVWRFGVLEVWGFGGLGFWRFEVLEVQGVLEV